MMVLVSHSGARGSSQSTTRATAERDFHAKILRYGDIPALRGPTL
jgi:hypothetical protein